MLSILFITIILHEYFKQATATLNFQSQAQVFNIYLFFPVIIVICCLLSY